MIKSDLGNVKIECKLGKIELKTDLQFLFRSIFEEKFLTKEEVFEVIENGYRNASKNEDEYLNDLFSETIDKLKNFMNGLMDETNDLDNE